MGRSSYRIYDTSYPYFMTSSFIQGFPIFSDPESAQIVLESLKFLQEKRRVTLYAYVLMENHFHLIAQSEDLSEKMRHFKPFTAREIIKLFKHRKRTQILRKLRDSKLRHKRNSTYQVWQESFHPKQIIGDKMMLQKIEYIHNNPVKRGYVNKPTDWRYTSAGNYEGRNFLIPVTVFKR